MPDSLVTDFTVQAMMLVLILSMPPILVATLVGILVSILQAVTQIQEQTLSFAVKLIVVIITILLTARWVGGELFHFSLKIFNDFPMLLK
jgi:type III secretion protein S